MNHVLEIPTARAFAPLLEPARYKGAYGGRGSGKSHFFAELAVEACIQFPGTRGVCVREVQKSLRESVKLLIEDKIDQMQASGFKIRNENIGTPGGGILLFIGMQDYSAEAVKSLEGFHFAYCEEAQTLTAKSLEMLRPTIRRPASKEWPAGSELWFSWNPRDADDPVDLLLRGDSPPDDSVVVRANYTENPFFPDVLEDERLYDEKTYPHRYPHIWLGEYEPAAVGAIFDRRNIQQNRRDKERQPAYKRVVVAIDPAGSSEPGSDETGIVVTAEGEDGRGYVLDDLSIVGSPKEWADRALAAYDLYEGDAIVAEVNFGGDMVANTIRSIRPGVRVIEVRAKKSKHVRAEPIAALYSLGRISHVGTFPKLESQMCLITAGGYEGKGSPDRCDAMVWGFSELFGRLTKKTRAKGSAPQRANNKYSPHRWR